MLAKSMERMALEAIGARQRPVSWIMTQAALDSLRNHDELAPLDAPRLTELDPPLFMGIPVVIGDPGEPRVRLVTDECATPPL